MRPNAPKPEVNNADASRRRYLLALVGLAVLGVLLAALPLATNLLSQGGSTPPHAPVTWTPALRTLHLVSDLLIAAAYLSIPLTIAYFVRRRRDLPFNWVFVLLAAFVVAGGVTHLIEV